MLKVLDLFSGIGGFSLGLERTGGFKTVAFCEIEPFCRQVLKKHWPDVPIFEDVRTLKGSDVGDCQVIAGGFPCQPFSTASAGKRYGAAHDEYLWPEMWRLIQECKPTWVIGENVAGIESMGLEQVVSDLEACGYETAPPLEIPACAVGHDHRRTRFWFLAYADQSGKPSSPINAKAPILSGGDCDRARVGAAHGVPSELDRLRSLGNAVVPQIPEIIGRAILSADMARPPSRTESQPVHDQGRKA